VQLDPTTAGPPDGADRSVQRVGFLIVGTPRSGTTLVQRLAMELDGVRTPPETHFFSTMGLSVPLRQAFPMDERALREELELFVAAPSSQGLGLRGDDVIEDLGGRCDSLFDLFDAVVSRVAGPAEVLGEKTPGHVFWWRPLTEFRPDLKVIVTVRDPRAVVASNLPAPWREPERRVWDDDHYLALAVDWRFQQRLALQLRDTLGPDRCLVLRYEDVVADPDAARRAIGRLLGRPVSGQGPPHRRDIVLPWESWKDNAVGPVTSDRVSAWRSTLPAGRAAVIAGICHAEMAAFGYHVPRYTAAVWPLRLSWRRHYRLRAYAGELEVEQALIDNTRF
jgi:hypothetical protein